MQRQRGLAILSIWLVNAIMRHGQRCQSIARDIQDSCGDIVAAGPQGAREPRRLAQSRRQSALSILLSRLDLRLAGNAETVYRRGAMLAISNGRPGQLAGFVAETSRSYNGS